MSNKIRLWPYKLGSSGCKALQEALQAEGIDCLRVRTDGGYRPRANHLIINWGNSQEPRGFSVPIYTQFLNSIHGIDIASNKLKTFITLTNAQVKHPVWTNDLHGATLMINNGEKVYCRTKLSGHSGAGIVVARTIEELVDAPLYTVGIDIKGEYRIHVFKGSDGLRVIDAVKKRRRNDAADTGTINSDIRNLDGGWVYCHNNVMVTDETKELAVKAIEALGLDFGAVDIVIEKNTEKPYVLEVNTAPGLSSPTTINAYVNAIKTYMEVQ